MTADALGRVLEICKNWNTQRVYNSHRRSLQRTLHRYRGCTIDTEFRRSQNPVHSATTECPTTSTPIHGCDTMPCDNKRESDKYLDRNPEKLSHSFSDKTREIVNPKVVEVQWRNWTDARKTVCTMRPRSKKCLHKQTTRQRPPVLCDDHRRPT